MERNYVGDAIGGELGGALAAAEASSAHALPSSPPLANAGSTVNFVLMTRKGNKPQFKSMTVPSDSDLALNLRNREEVTIHFQVLNLIVSILFFLL